MYNSIAPVELTTQMQRQLSGATNTTSSRKLPAHAPAGIRHRVSEMLHSLANTLAPASAAR